MKVCPAEIKKITVKILPVQKLNIVIYTEYDVSIVPELHVRPQSCWEQPLKDRYTPEPSITAPQRRIYPRSTPNSPTQTDTHQNWGERHINRYNLQWEKEQAQWLNVLALHQGHTGDSSTVPCVSLW